MHMFIQKMLYPKQQNRKIHIGLKYGHGYILYHTQIFSCCFTKNELSKNIRILCNPHQENFIIYLSEDVLNKYKHKNKNNHWQHIRIIIMLYIICSTIQILHNNTTKANNLQPRKSHRAYVSQQKTTSPQCWYSHKFSKCENHKTQINWRYMARFHRFLDHSLHWFSRNMHLQRNHCYMSKIQTKCQS